MSVAEIATLAKVSVGGFYARFAGKGDLLSYLNHHVLEGVLASLRARLGEKAVLEGGPRAVIQAFVELGIGAFRTHRTVMKQVSLRSRTSVEPAFRERIQDLNRDLHDTFRERLGERMEAIGHPQPRLAIDIGLTAVSGAMREYVLFQDLRPHFDPVTDETLARELTDLFCRYLRLEP